MNIEELYSVFTGSSGVTTDTRAIAGNEIFFALKGENFNGNTFVREALDRGCKFVVADDPSLASLEGVEVVKDVLEVLQELAIFHRRRWKGRVLAITGSNGKTTTKELVASVLSRRYKILFSEGNLNNHIGVPLTLLKIRDEEIAIIEMGANHQGEIARLSEIVAPDVGIITNIGKAHLEGFGGLEGVKRGKGELYDYLALCDRLAIVNMSDPILASMVKERGLKYFSYGTTNDCTVQGRLQESEIEIDGSFTIEGVKYMMQSGLFGSYNFMNMLTAAATGIYYGVLPSEISRAIASYIPENNRSQVIKGKSNTLIMDAYNANPTSMSLALDEFERCGHEKKMVILGDMHELGEDESPEHEAVLRKLVASGLRDVLLVGERFSRFSATPDFPFRFFSGLGKCMEYLHENKPEKSLILLKGSRKNALEKLTNLLLNN
ncbi:MAG: UDP-N-acetylmuramoyl-tripeptide--D-alanyl-D-alanine ligase [Bacteroidales bacterium]